MGACSCLLPTILNAICSMAHLLKHHAAQLRQRPMIAQVTPFFFQRRTPCQVKSKCCDCRRQIPHSAAQSTPASKQPAAKNMGRNAKLQGSALSIELTDNGGRARCRHLKRRSGSCIRLRGNRGPCRRRTGLGHAGCRGRYSNCLGQRLRCRFPGEGVHGRLEVLHAAGLAVEDCQVKDPWRQKSKVLAMQQRAGLLCATLAMQLSVVVTTTTTTTPPPPPPPPRPPFTHRHDVLVQLVFGANASVQSSPQGASHPEGMPTRRVPT